jgi:hypothetical protein
MEATITSTDQHNGRTGIGHYLLDALIDRILARVRTPHAGASHPISHLSAPDVDRVVAYLQDKHGLIVNVGLGGLTARLSTDDN